VCITIKVIAGLLLLVQAWRLVSKGGKRTLVGCVCIWFAIGALGSAALDIFRIVDSRAPQQLAPTATAIPTPRPGPTPTPIKRSIEDFSPLPERTPSDLFSMCDFNCDQYKSETWDPYLGYDTLEYLECLGNQGRCVDAIISGIEQDADSLEREMEREGKGLPDKDWDYPENWY
jgi:hypothetical protein